LIISLNRLFDRITTVVLEAGTDGIPQSNNDAQLFLQQPKYSSECCDLQKENARLRILHVESVPAKEVFESQIAWDGSVEVFDLIGHPKAKRAYAWTYRDGNQNKTIAVLGIPPVDSPQSAVKVAVAPDDSASTVKTAEHGVMLP
jgi:hypothetical protein